MKPRLQSIRQRWPVGLALVYALTGLYVVRPEQQAVVRLLGRAGAPVKPGLHYRLPYPLTRIDKVKVYERKRVSVGFRLGDQTTGRQPQASETQFLTGDENLVNIQMLLQYTVRDPRQYLFAAVNPERLLEAAASAALTEQLTPIKVDEVLTVGRTSIQNAVHQRAQEIVDAYGCGVQIDNVTITQVLPPPEVADAFKDVASARGDAVRFVNEAHGYASDILPRARGEAQRMLREAEAYQVSVVNQAKGDAQRFEELLAEYAKAPDVTRTRIYLEAMEEILPRLNKVLVDGGREPVDLTMIQRALKSQDAAAATPSPATTP